MLVYFVGTRTEPDLAASRKALDEALGQRKIGQEDFDKQVALLSRWQAAIDTQNERGKLTFHSLRHATATAAIASGANVQTVSSLLGHANSQITLTTYADEWAAKLNQDTAAGIAGVLFGSNVDSGSRTVAEGETVAPDDEPGPANRQQTQGVNLVGRVGLEPTTKRLRVSCSTN